MAPTFDLTEEPWITVIRLDNGRLEEVGLQEALSRAHEFRAVRDPLPTVEFGLYRLLVVLALDIFKPKNKTALSRLVSQKKFDAAQVEAYLHDKQDRFDLFSQQHPFLQTAGMEGEAVKPLAGLLPPIPSGTNAAHFHHGQEGEFGVSPAAAARLLTSVAPFMTAGGAGLAPSLNGAPPWYALIVGDTLFDTLCRNAYVLDRQNIALGEPSWRSDRAVMPGERCTNADLLEGWTWRPRRLQLVPGEAGRCSLTGQDSPMLVRSMKFAAGASCDFTKGGWRDPSVPYRIDDDGPKVMRPQEGKAVWRDTAPLALLSSRSYTRGESKFQFERPHIVEQWAQMIQDRYAEDGLLNLTLYGMRTDLKMKVFEWYREPLALPRSLVLKDEFALRVQQEMERADSIAYALKKAIQKTYKREGKGNAKAFDDLIAYTQRQYWSSIRGAWERLLEEVASLPAAQEAAFRAAWWEVLRGAGSAALKQAIGDLDTDAEALKRQVEAEQSFYGALHNILATGEERAAREAAKKSKKAKSKKAKSKEPKGAAL